MHALFTTCKRMRGEQNKNYLIHQSFTQRTLYMNPRLAEFFFLSSEEIARFYSFILVRVEKVLFRHV